jgi:hypothetical protein
MMEWASGGRSTRQQARSVQARETPVEGHGGFTAVLEIEQ